MPVPTTQDIVLGVLSRLPSDASLEQVARELEFIAGVREGFAQLARGEGVSLDEVERRLPIWSPTHPSETTK